MFNAFSPRTAAAYQRINVETSMHTIDQHQIVSLLFDGFLSSVATARGALSRNDIPTKCASISKAIRIMEEGLATGLDTVDGGNLASNLQTLYAYCTRRLTLANAQNDDAILQEVQRLIEPVAQSWKSIAGTSAQAPADTEPLLKLVEA
jgi:flagellar secretion chaperone FliS